MIRLFRFRNDLISIFGVWGKDGMVAQQIGSRRGPNSAKIVGFSESPPGGALATEFELGTFRSFRRARRNDFGASGRRGIAGRVDVFEIHCYALRAL
jgi:hypothetical protein